ncbi:hypothetical protein MVEN_00759900 [Mycena venus]|uniref:Uncharacterized protein n=1 Tax=Mycena venus TaxID=2733690 RepID=A0A8H6YL62_9AGAR|nr:hypothetical protein MVEN_00759900 [Mycena venus]
MPALLTFLYMGGGHIIGHPVTLLYFWLFRKLLAHRQRAANPDTPSRHQPHDEESLVPDNVAAEPRGVRGFLSSRLPSIIIAVLLLPAAALQRPKGSTLVLGTYQVLKPVTINLGLSITFFFFLGILILAPIIIFRRERGLLRAMGYSTLLILGILFYALLLQGITLFHPESPFLQTVFSHLTWQASLLAVFCRCFGLGTYFIGTSWLLTNVTSMFLLRRCIVLEPRHFRKAKKLGDSPPPPYIRFSKLFQPMFMPAVFLCKGYLYTAPTFLAGLTSAGIILAWATAVALALFFVDVLFYWVWFDLRTRKPRREGSTSSPSSLDRMALILGVHTVRNAEGETLVDIVRKRKARAAAQQLEGKVEGTETNVDGEKSEKDELVVMGVEAATEKDMGISSEATYPDLLTGIDDDSEGEVGKQ